MFINDLGSSWYVNSEADGVEVYEITADMITDKILEKYDRDLFFCNLGRENLTKMFYDKDGWVYFKTENYFKEEKYYRFNLRIKEFARK